MDLFIVVILFAVGGGLFLWASGFFSGQSRGSGGVSARVHEKIQGERDRFADQLEDSEIQVRSLTEQLVRAEGAADNLREKMDLNNAELDRARAELAGLRRMTLAPGVGEDLPDEPGETDGALAELDQERVAHRKTIEELKSAQSQLFKLRDTPQTSSIPPDPAGSLRGDAVSRVEWERLKRERDRFRGEVENFRKQSLAYKQDHSKIKNELEKVKKENEGLMQRLERWTD